MANIKIAQLTNQINIADTDLILIESATSTNKMTLGKLKELLGIQSGGIEESGNNANGRWIKYKDGTMEIFARKTYDGNTNGTQCTFPQPFSEVSSIALFAQVEGIISGGANVTYGCEKIVDTQSTYRIKPFAISADAVNTAAPGTLVSIHGIGRWK